MQEAIPLSLAVEEGGRQLMVHGLDLNATAGAAPAVLFLHGSGPGTTGWGAFAASASALADAGFRAIVIDLPGWGRSEPLVCSGPRCELNARVALGVLDALGVARAHLVGSSMGAHSAVALALAAPDRVGRLVLCSGGTGSGLSAHPGARGAALMQRFYREPGVETLRALLMAVSHDTSKLSEAVVRERLARCLQRPEHIRNFARSLQANPVQFRDVRGSLSQVQAATLLVWGREDCFVPLEVGLDLVRRIPRAELHVLSQCGHVPHLEKPARVIPLINDFLAEGQATP